VSDSPAFARLDLAPTWARFNEELIQLVDYVPDEQLNWSPKPELWNFRGILLHLADTRDNWIGHGIEDGVEWKNVWQTVRTKDEIKSAFARTWERLAAVLSDQEKLDATYETQDPGEPVELRSGHWIMFHLLEHDIHHRADIFHYLALLGIATPGVGTP
jgi:uncharacterized damage-inducible protein DinB